MRSLMYAATLSVLALPGIADPLPSWTATKTKAKNFEFVEQVTDPASPNYVTPADRIAIFYNDGTLWGEEPMYFQLIYELDRLKARAAGRS